MRFGNQEKFEESGFSFSITSVGSLVFNLTLTFTASVEKNETQIRCSNQESVSNIATLIVMGKFVCAKGCTECA